MVKTIEELKKVTDRELLKMVDEASGKTNLRKEEFKQVFETELGYSDIQTELVSRGFVNGWYKPTDIVEVKMSKDNDRMNLNMSKSCKARYEKFLSDKSFNYVHTTAALEHYMDDYATGRIKVRLEV